MHPSFLAPWAGRLRAVCYAISRLRAEPPLPTEGAHSLTHLLRLLFLPCLPFHLIYVRNREGSEISPDLQANR